MAIVVVNVTNRSLNKSETLRTKVVHFAFGLGKGILVFDLLGFATCDIWVGTACKRSPPATSIQFIPPSTFKTMTDFENAVKFVQSSSDPSLDNETKLNFYKWYKQGTTGDCSGSRPGVFDLKGKAKWDAWNSVKGMSQDEAKKQYVQALTSKIPHWKSG